MTEIPALFDKKGSFVLPPAETLDAIKPAIKDRIIGIGTAAQEVLDADTGVATAHQTIRDAQRVLNEAIANDRKRPVVTPISAARAWIESQKRDHAQRR